MIVVLALLAVVAFMFAVLYWRAIRESNHLVCFIGYLLLVDDIRATQKQSFEKWIRDSTAKDATSLSVAAMAAIRNLSERLASGDPKKPATSSVLGFHAFVWNRKKELHAEAK